MAQKEEKGKVGGKGRRQEVEGEEQGKSLLTLIQASVVIEKWKKCAIFRCPV